jgi:hypothetical protein
LGAGWTKKWGQGCSVSIGISALLMTAILGGWTGACPRKVRGRVPGAGFQSSAASPTLASTRGGMLARTGLNAGRLLCRGPAFRIAGMRWQSTTAPTVPLSFDLHLPPSKDEYSSAQKAPAVVLMHGVPSLFHPQSVDFVVLGLKIEFTYPLKTPR